MAAPFSREIAVSGMAAFEDRYNADDTSFCGNCYTDPCDVRVLVGPNEDVAFTGTTPGEVAQFLNGLRNSMGGTNMKFTVTETSESGHKDTWIADNGTGSCDATWKVVDGDWKICKDIIRFSPKSTDSS